MEDIHNTLEACKSASLAAENINYQARLVFDVEYGGAIYQADKKSFDELMLAINQDVLPDNFYWIDKLNNKVPMTKVQLKELADVIFARRFALFDEHQRRKEGLRAATAVEHLFGSSSAPA